MITQDDVTALAGLGPEETFSAIERLARRRLSEARRSADQNEIPEYDDFDYMVSVLAAAEEFGIEELASYEMPRRSSSDCQDRCQTFRDEASRVSQRLLYRHGMKRTTVALDGATKEKISHWLKQVREVVQSADVSAEKKDRLFDLINRLQAEVDRARTPVHAAGTLWVEICTYFGEGARATLEPATPFIERICSALGLAKRAEDAAPKKIPPAETKRIEARNPKPKGFDKPVDDEIPF
jgi:hypothetical protein